MLALLDGLDWERARVCDVGAGNGYLSQALGERLRRRGLDPGAHLAACDVVPEEFRYAPVRCAPIGTDGRLPYGRRELRRRRQHPKVVEHVENQFAFLREVARIARPGARIVVTTPTRSTPTRACAAWRRASRLFDPLPLADGNVRHLSGHIHPISPYFLAVARPARRSRSSRASIPTAPRPRPSSRPLLLAPVLWLGAAAPAPPPAASGPASTSRTPRSWKP